MKGRPNSLRALNIDCIRMSTLQLVAFSFFFLAAVQFGAYGILLSVNAEHAEGLDGTRQDSTCEPVNLVREKAVLAPIGDDVRKVKLDRQLFGWWADGSKAFKVENNMVEVECGLKALGMYQYIPLDSGFIRTANGVQLSFTSSFLGTQAASAAEPFRGIKLFHLGDDGDVLELFEFTHEGHTQQFIATDLRVEAFVLLIACAGFSGKLYMKDLLLEPVYPSMIGVDSAVAATGLEGLCLSQRSKRATVGFEYKQVWRSSTNSRYTVVLATHFTPDRIPYVANVLSSWGCDNPASLAMFAEDEEVEATVAALKDQLLERGCMPGSISNIELVVVLKGSRQQPYPINHLRNVAWKGANGRYVFLVDADVGPSSLAFFELSRFLWEAGDKSNVAYVVPVFEATETRSIPRTLTKRKLHSLFKRGRIAQYKAVYQPKAHGATDYSRWFQASSPYQVDFVPQFEPYLVLPQSTAVQFDERFVDYGWNKVAFTTELSYAGYSFVVVPDVWAIHQNHPKTKTSISFAYNLTTRSRNRIARYQWLIGLYCKYEWART